jgi:hypothetical protein
MTIKAFHCPLLKIVTMNKMIGCSQVDGIQLPLECGGRDISSHRTETKHRELFEVLPVKGISGYSLNLSE